MSMTLDEMKLSVCEKLPEVIRFSPIGSPIWRKHDAPVFWPTEGLQVCHEAEKLIKTQQEWSRYHFQLRYVVRAGANINKQLSAYDDRDVTTATYEQRLEALCRVWWPERFTV